jgi:hypothetical protein
VIAVSPGLDVSLAVRARLADLYCAYDDTLNNGELESWPALFTEDCLYKILPRDNHERGLPVAVIYCESGPCSPIVWSRSGRRRCMLRELFDG